MRWIVLIAALCLIGLALASPVWENNASEADALLAVDAGVEHENAGERQARGFGFGRGFGGYGRGFGGYGGYGGFGGYRGFGHHHHHGRFGGFYG